MQPRRAPTASLGVRLCTMLHASEELAQEGLVWMKASPMQKLPGIDRGPRRTKSMAWMSCLAQATFPGYHPNKPEILEPGGPDKQQRLDLVNGGSDSRFVRLACQSTSQQYCSLILIQHQPPATSQSAVLFSHNKSAPATSHSQANTTKCLDSFKCQALLFSSYL